MKSSMILLKALLQSTSLSNRYKYSTDRKKKRKIIAAYIGLVCLYAMLMGYSISMCIGYGIMGHIDAVPVLCALTISILGFFFTIFKTNGYLFNFKEYDMLMALPFEPGTVAACKFLYMYIKNLPWYLSISLAMMIGYGFYGHPGILTYPLWLILTLFLPLIPMIAAAFVGFLIARISAGFRKTNVIQTILTFIFVIFCFSLQYIIDALFKNDQVETVLTKASEITEQAGNIYLPAGWFAGAVKACGISDGLLLIGASLILFAVVFYIVGNSYRSINSKMKNHAAAKKYTMTGQKKHNVVNAIAYKEFKRMMGSTAYMVNAGMGEVLCVLFGILTLIIGFDKIISIVTKGAPFDPSILQPSIPFIIYFLIGMVATTAMSPSLEGKNYWILQSLPIEKKTIARGKMLFNLYLTVPFMTFGILCLCISAKVSVVDSILYLLHGLVLCAFSTTWGCVCGIRHLKLEWENEIEVIKQSAAVAIYLLPNMFVTLGLIVLMVVLGMHMDHRVLTLIMILIAAVLTALSYWRIMALCKKE